MFNKKILSLVFVSYIICWLSSTCQAGLGGSYKKTFIEYLARITVANGYNTLAKFFVNSCGASIYSTDKNCKTLFDIALSSNKDTKEILKNLAIKSVEGKEKDKINGCDFVYYFEEKDQAGRDVFYLECKVKSDCDMLELKGAKKIEHISGKYKDQGKIYKGIAFSF